MKDKELWWQTLSSRFGPDIPLFSIRLDTMRHPTSAAEMERLVFESTDWVNVVATTPENQFVMVEQFRFGIGDLTVEPVGGLVDEGEDSLAAARRELLEETGYAGDSWRYLGSVQANPAIHNNVCHHWLAENVSAVQAPQPDEGEAIRVHLMSLDEVRAAHDDGRFRHPLGLSAFSRVYPLWDAPITAVSDQL